jgi:hypothetical protein
MDFVKVVVVVVVVAAVVVVVAVAVDTVCQERTTRIVVAHWSMTRKDKTVWGWR